MTTIAADAREGVMCCDSTWNDGTEKGFFKKVFRVRGALVGLAGSVTEIARWLHDYRSGVDVRGQKYEIAAIRLTWSGVERWTSGDDWFPVGVQHAIGTGGMAARAAMAAGAPCRRAVQIAITIDAGSNGPVRTYHLTRPN